MAALTAEQRRKIPDKDFGLPGKGKGPEGKGSGSYPLNDKKHAALAKAEATKHATPAEKKIINAKANRVLQGNKGGNSRAVSRKGM